MLKDNLTVTFTSPSVPVFTVFHDSGRVIDSKISFSSFLSKYYGIGINRNFIHPVCTPASASDVFLERMDYGAVYLTDRQDITHTTDLDEILNRSNIECLSLSLTKFPESIEDWVMNLDQWACEVRAILLSKLPSQLSVSVSVHINFIPKSNGVFLS